MPTPLAILLILLLVPAQDAADLFLAGAEHLSRGEYREAEAALEGVLEALPDRPDALLLLGIARYHLDRPRDALGPIEAALEGGTRYESRGLYYLGLTLSLLGREEEAERAFARLIREKPDSPEVQEILSLREEDEEPEPSASAVLMTSLGYDSNAAQSADLPTATDPEADTFWDGALLGRFGSDHGPGLLRGGFTWKDFFRADTYDLVTARLAGEVTGFPSASHQVRPGAGVSHSWLGGADFESRLELGGAWWIGRESPRPLEVSVMEAFKRYPDEDYEGLDGTALTVTGRTMHALGPAEMGIAAEYVDDTAEEAYLGYRSWQGSVLLRLEVTSGSLADLEAGVRGRSYKDISPVYGERRRDGAWFVEGTVIRSIVGGLLVRARAAYLSNHSSVDDFTYEQFVGSLGLMVLF
jgi:tetratricopeptide (TPR) repeat protein